MHLVNKINSEHPLTASQIEKIGNSIIFLSDKIKPLFKTKVLKLLYIIEEFSIRKYGMPFFGVDFQLWRLGPVVKDVFIDLSSPTLLLNKYVDSVTEEDGTVIVAKNKFIDDEFSDCDIQILESVANTFRNYSAPELVNFTHRENFPWHVTAKQYGVLEAFNNNRIQSTDITIDMSMLLDETPELKDFYLSTLDFQRHNNFLKSNK